MAGTEERERYQFSLTETLEEATQQGEAQDMELKRNREVLSGLQKEVDELRVQISATKKLIFNKTQLLVKEQGTQTQLRKDIEIQNRRCEAILKRLRCQLNKAQSNHRQLTDDICWLEKEAEEMSTVLIVDLFHSDCLQYNACLHKRVKTAAAVIGERKYTRVYIMLQAHDRIYASSPKDTTVAQLQELIQLNENTRILKHSSVAASLYCFKQAVDELDQSTVLVLTSTPRIAELQAYQNRLFTALYTFEYAAVFDECTASGAETPTSAHIEEQVAIFLRQLPALKGEMSVLRSSLISDCFSHGFTTRTGGISYIPTLSSLNLFSSSYRRDPKAVVAENLRRLGLHAGFDPEKFHLVKTDHASDVWVMGKPPPKGYDGIVTNQVGVVIAAPGADCMPLLFTDPVAKVIGVAHAGWKGTLMGIAMATVSAMVTEFGSTVTDVVAVIGPSVGPCCFSLDKESAESFHTIHPSCVRARGSAKPYVDIRLATRILLQQGGVLPHHIQDDTVTDRPNLTLCTACHPHSFFSHVRDGSNFGTQIGFLWIKESNTGPL
ncbi:hypothetical protein SKAU_G00251250 [Synaphobranchus kaupii]|uniref:Purine nucleoside phosphorylase LACC1 n=1 Tax=Synaphobranchus kaupii TaxID=118154 RepID=A0A9Q1F2W6_SYNKA|nr:hypothetical protein SKAU_G00251250 [Synaphobranchus kaupii]